MIQQPNFFGQLEDVDALTRWARANGALVIAAVNPVSLALLTPPGEWGDGGADIACGEAQPFGVPLSSGGPYVGFMTSAHGARAPDAGPHRRAHASIVDGKPGFTLTLQAREQHIRRGKATSNICTNQGLLMTAATIYLALLGPAGLERVAQRLRRAHAANWSRRSRASLACAPPSPDHASTRPCCSSTGRSRRCSSRSLRRASSAASTCRATIPELGHALLVCATETRTQRRHRTLCRRALGGLLGRAAAA